MKEVLEKWRIVPINNKIYEVALSHTSYSNEHRDKRNYERLEFLGDAVLELVMSDYLYRNYEQDEGDMTKKRANYVCENALYEYMSDLDLIKEIKVGNGEIGNVKKAIVADCFEALMGAIYLDQGFDTVKRVILEVITPYIINNRITFLNDYKSILQEAMQTDRRSLVYNVIDESGPAHNKTFTVEVRIDNIVYGKGSAGSKKEACQMAARATLEKLAKN